MINIISLPLITRLYLPSDIGTLKVFMEALALCAVIISFKVEHVVILPTKTKDARELLLFVFSWGIISFAIVTFSIVMLGLFALIPQDIFIWALFLPLTAFLCVLSGAVQQLSQRSSNFKKSGLSEVINRSSNNGSAILAGFFSAPGIALVLAMAIGFFFKALTFFDLIKDLGLNLLKNLVVGFRRLKNEGLGKILGSLIFSQISLSVTTIAPLWYISIKWGSDYVGFFSLVLATLALPATFIGKAVGQVYYQRASSTFTNGQSFQELFLANLSFLVCLAIPGFGVVYYFADYLYPFIFGHAWITAGLIAKYYVFAAAMSFVSVPFEKSAIIVNAWWYGPGWYIIRVLTTIMVIYFNYLYEGTFFGFIIWLSIQIATMHLLDALASYIFSLRDLAFS